MAIHTMESDFKTINGESVLGGTDMKVGINHTYNSDVNGVYEVGDTYLSPTNIAYYKSQTGWVKIGEMVSGSGGGAIYTSGGAFSVFLLEDGTVVASGSNTYGQLGDGTTDDSLSPVGCSGLTGVTKLESGDNFTLALLSDGTVKSWGGNAYGQLGNGNTDDVYTPTLISGLTGVVDISVGRFESYFLFGDGTVKACGHNNQGQLGDGTKVDKSSPVDTLISNVIKMGGGREHQVFLLGDGTLKSVGKNYYGQLGDGTTDDSLSPVDVIGLTDIIDITSGFYHSVALSSSGDIYTWGAGSRGQLGNGTTDSNSTPSLVDSGSSEIVTGISTCAYSSIIIFANNTATLSGRNGSGELGDGSSTDILSFTYISGWDGIISCSDCVGFKFICCKEDGTLLSSGVNAGSYGNGSSTNSDTVINYDIGGIQISEAFEYDVSNLI